MYNKTLIFISKSHPTQYVINACLKKFKIYESSIGGSFPILVIIADERHRIVNVTAR